MMTERGGRMGTGAANVRMRHIPVLLSQVLAALKPAAGETFIDATFGAGGYTRAILEAGARRVIAIDRDPHAVAQGRTLQAAFPGRLEIVEHRFSALADIARRADAAPVDGVVLDVGVSSPQLDDPARGFSFQASGPLDMRMSGDGPTAADIVNAAPEEEIAAILFHLGEERRSRAIARAIVKARDTEPIATTDRLAAIVERVLGRARAGRIHPATRTFQALRIYVNDELAELAQALQAAEQVLKPGGRLAVVTFHSLEDRIAKRFLALRAGRTASASRHLPQAGEDARAPSFQIINQPSLTSSLQEIAANPRSRSARLRAAERTEAPAWPSEDVAELGVPQLQVSRGRTRRGGP